MSFTRIVAMARKEVIQIRRDVRSLIIVIAMPVVLVLLFGYGVNLDLKHMPVYVYDREASQDSQAFLKRFQASDYFDVVRIVNHYPDLVRAIDAGQAKMGLVIPYDFSQRIHTGQVADVQAIVDATDDNSANVLIGYTQAVVQGYSNDIQMQWLERHGQTRPQFPLSVDTRTWYNEDLESSAFIIPGVLALVMSVIGAFLTSLTIAREWERGTMEQLVSTPVAPFEIMLGKLAPYFAIGLGDAGICAVLAIFWFQVPFRGSVTALLVSSAVFLISLLCLGFFISVIAKNQLTASQVSLIATFLPAFLLSGFLFAIEQMPAFIRFVTRLLPARYYVSLLKEIFLKGTPLNALYTNLLPLIAIALVLALLATRSFHKQLS
jgi:ABC-2 type transport system permease protein